MPALIDAGWVSQFKLLTGVKGYSLEPRVFWLDFAIPDRKLCVEIDGSAHRVKTEKDERRDRMMIERGWKILRIPSSIVTSEMTEALAMIERFKSLNDI